MATLGQTEQLDIAPVAYPDGDGWIGLCACPGRNLGGLVNRDLEEDLAAIHAWGARHLVSLIEDHEFTQWGVEELPQAVAAYNLAWHHLPIIDGAAPGTRFERAWAKVGRSLHRHLEGGGRVVIHCLGGIGRSGTVAVRMLMEKDIPFDEALALVRRARPGAVESEEQLHYLASSDR